MLLDRLAIASRDVARLSGRLEQVARLVEALRELVPESGRVPRLVTRDVDEAETMLRDAAAPPVSR